MGTYRFFGKFIVLGDILLGQNLEGMLSQSRHGRKEAHGRTHDEGSFSIDTHVLVRLTFRSRTPSVVTP